MINNRTKLFLLFTIIFIATIGISAVTAADINDNTTDIPVIAETPSTDVVEDVQTNCVNNKAEIIKNTQNDVKTATTGDFNDLATDIDAASEVTLTKNYAGNIHTKYLQLNSSKTIDGAGHTISNITKGLFEITSGNTLTLKNLKITGGNVINTHVFQVKGNLICENVTVDFKDLPTNTKRKSIINLMDNDTLVSLTDCTIKNYASWGSVYSTDSCTGTLLMDNCTIQNNTPGTYGLIIIDAPGSNATIKNSKFIKNIGISQYSGAIAVKNQQNHVLIENCLFDGNTASYYGGAIFVRGNVTVKNSVFKDNTNIKTGSTGKGTIHVSGGILYLEGNTMDDLTPVEIYVSSGNVSSPVLKGVDVAANPNEEINITYTLTDDMGNSIVYSGGSYTMTLVYQIRTVSASTVTDTNGTITATFKAPKEEGRYPVSITFNSVSTVEGNDVIIINPSVVVGNVGYDHNLTDETWDQFFNKDGTPKEDIIGEYDILKFNGKFTDRHMNINFPLTITTGETQAVLDGCTIKVNSEIKIKNITATNTYVEVLDGKKLNLTNSSFTDTYTNIPIIDVGKNTLVKVEKTNFTNIGNEGVIITDSNSLVEIKESLFKNCTSNAQGGAIITKENSNVTVDACVFANNSAELRGGAICSLGNLTVKNSDFTGNKVLSTKFEKDQGGAAIYVEGNLWLYDNYMDKNTGLTGDIYNGGGIIRTHIIFVFDDVEAKQGSEVEITGTVTDNDGNTIDFYANKKDGEYYLNHNLTVDDTKYDLTRHQTLKGIINRPIKASLAPGNYTISAEVDDHELVDYIVYPGKLEIIGNPDSNVNLTDETWDQFFYKNGTLREGIVNEGDELQFHGTFTNRKMNINKAITITTGEDQAIFNGCYFNLSGDINVQNVQFTGTTNTAVIDASGNINFKNVTFDQITAKNQRMINPTIAGTNITIENSVVNEFNGGAVVRATFTNITLNINNSKITNNNGTTGLINGDGTGWKVNINNSNFTDNIGQQNGIIRSGKSGFTLNIDNSIFERNLANAKAGIFYGNSNNQFISITNSNFTENGVSDAGTGSSPKNLAGVFCTSSPNTNLTLSNNIMTGSIAANGTDIYFELTSQGTSNNRIYTNAKLIAENATTNKDQYVDLKFKLTDDMGNLIGFKGENNSVFNYSVTVNDEEISYIDDVYYGKIYDFHGVANKTINATYPAGTYPIILEIKGGENRFDSLEIINGQLEVITPKPTPTISYEVLNDVAGKVAIEFTLVDEEGSEISPAALVLTGDITATANTNKLYKNSELTEGEYAVNVKFEETEDYQEATLDFTLTVQKNPQPIIDELNESLINNETELNNTISEIERLQAENNLLEEQIENLTEALEANQTALAGNITALEEATEQIAQLEQNITTLTEALEANQTALAGNITALEEATEQIAQLEQNITTLTEALEANQTALAQAEETITELENNITTLKEELADTQSALTEAEETITELENNITTLEEELADTQSDLAESEEENAELTAKVEELEAALAANQTALAEAQETIIELENNVTALESELNKTNAALSEAQETIEDLNNVIDALEDELEQTQTELNETQEALDEANETINDLNNVIDALEDELEETQTELAETQEALNDANEAIEELEYKVSELELGLDIANKALDKAIEAITQLNQPKTTSISINPITNAKYGDEINITGLLVNEDAIGLANQPVTITLNGEEINVTTRNGEFTYTTTATIIGENTITATYAGSDKYVESEATATFNVAKANTTIELTELEAVKKGDVASISGVLYDHNNNALANTVVRLLVNNGRKTVKTDKMGAFSFDYTTTRVGINTLTATFEGNDYYEANTTETTFEVNPLETVITINPIDTVTKGNQATITGTLTDENNKTIANANIKIIINGSQKTVKTDSEGRFTHTYTFGQIGENTIIAAYAGSTNYEATNAETTVNVTKTEATITLAPIEEVSVGSTVTISGTLTYADGNPIANTQVKVLINGSPKTLKTNELGAFTHTFKMTKEGTNNITAIFNGNNDYIASEANSSVEVIKAE